MIKLTRVTLFVDDLDGQTAFYRDVLELEIVEIRKGWSEFRSGCCVIALHKGKGRKPRLEFHTTDSLEAAREALNSRGARLGPIKTLAGKRVSLGKDLDGNTIQLAEQE